MKIPFLGERECSLILPFVFFVAIISKFFFLPLNLKIKKNYVNEISFALFFFFVFIIITFFNNIQMPGGSVNSGFLGRWNLINTLFVFFSILLTFKIEILDILLEHFYKFYKTILVLSLLILFLNIEKIPIFNTFSWMVIKENASSNRMIIAGISAVMVLIYILCFKEYSLKTSLVFLLSFLGVLFCGGRSTFFSFFIIIFCYWAIKNRILGQATLLSLVPICLFIVFSLSPLVFYVPVKFQRLFVVFPSEFYTGSLRQLKKTSAASSSNFRYEMWSKAISEIPDNVLIGKGLGVPKAEYSFDRKGMDAFREVSSKTLISDFMNTGGLHNTFVSIAFIMGIPAFILFFYFFLKLTIAAYSTSLKLKEKYRMQMFFFTLILIYYLIKSIISDIYFELDFFAFLAIIFKTVYIYKGHKTALSIKK
ncbi:MAG: O-antigen ligase family protein [Bacteroidota bacterium]